MSIANKTIAGFVSIVFVASALTFAPVKAQNLENMSIDELIALVEQLTNQRNAITSSSSSRPTSTSSSCAYTFTRNLVAGDRGEDVRQLQILLNSNPATVVASSGPGSQGQETTYYGPATARAVSKFQEVYASDILTPLGLTRGTGNFYTSTIRKANSLCTGSSSRPSTSRTTFVGTGDITVRGASNQIRPATVIGGAHRVPFTSFTLTASDNATVNGVVVKRAGLVGNDSFANVYLVDSKGVRIGKKRSLDRDNEARIGGRFDLRRGDSVTLTVVADMDTTNFDSGAIAGLDVIEIVSSGSVSGVSVSNPIEGARHSFSDPITLQSVEIDFGGNTGTPTIELNEEEEIVSFEIEATTSGADEEDYYLKSFSFENKGNLDASDVRSIVAEVEREDYRATVEDDVYTFTLPGKGYLIEDNESIDVTIRAEFDGGSGDKFQVELDASDFYFIGASYGYGLPTSVTNGGANNRSGEITIGSGSVGADSRIDALDNDDFDISYGDNVLLGAVEYEITGEDIELDTLEFEVTLDTGSNWTGNEEPEELIIENAVLEVAGERAFFAEDDIEFTTSKKAFTGNDAIEFEGTHIVEANEDDGVLFAIYGNLDSDWGHSEIDGATIEFKLVGVEDAESTISEEDKSGNFLTENSNSERVFDHVTIEGNEYEFTLRSNDVEEDEVVAGTNDIIFGTLRVDAEDAVDDIILTDVTLTMTAANGADLDDINGCVITDSRDRELADARNPSGSSDDTLDFGFDGRGYTVDAGEEVDLFVKCDVDEDAETSDTFTLSVETTDTLDYEIDGDEFEHAFDNRDSETITVASTGSLEVTLISPEEGVDAIAVGNGGRSNVEILSFELEADKEDLEITDIVLGNLDEATSSSNSVVDIIERVTVTIGGQSESEDIDSASDISSGNYTYEDHNGSNQTITGAYGSSGITIENVNVVIPAGRIVEGTVTVDYKGIDDDEGVDGQAVKLELMSVIFEGEGSDKIAAVEKKNTSGHDAEIRAFRNILTVSTSETDTSIRSGNRKIYSVTLRAEGEDGDRVYVDGFSFTTSRNAVSGDDSVTIAEAKLQVRGSTKATVTDVDDTNTSTVVSFDLTSPERIPVGDSVTFDVFADLTVSGDGDLNVVLKDDTTAALGAQESSVAATSGLTWTPNSLDNGDDTTSSNANWFNAYALYDSDDIEQYTLD